MSQKQCSHSDCQCDDGQIGTPSHEKVQSQMSAFDDRVWSQTELALFARAKPKTFPLLCWLVKATIATSIAKSIVSFQRRALMCHRFHQQPCFPLGFWLCRFQI